MSTHYKDYYGTHMPFGQFPKVGGLSSVKVLMTGTNIAGPFAASIMAEMGAQVVQVESPNMPCQTRGNYGYSQDHRNTYSITLNTRTAKGKEVLEKLIAWADIWIESGRPGTYAKNGLSDLRLRQLHQRQNLLLRKSFPAGFFQHLTCRIAVGGKHRHADGERFTED